MLKACLASMKGRASKANEVLRVLLESGELLTVLFIATIIFHFTKLFSSFVESKVLQESLDSMDCLVFPVLKECRVMLAKRALLAAQVPMV